MSHDSLFNSNKKTWVTANPACYPYYCSFLEISKSTARGKPPKNTIRKKKPRSAKPVSKKIAPSKTENKIEQSQTESSIKAKQNEAIRLDEAKVSPNGDQSDDKELVLETDSEQEPFTIILDAELDPLPEINTSQTALRNEFEPSQAKKVKMTTEEPPNQISKSKGEAGIQQSLQNGIVKVSAQTQKLSLEDCYFEAEGQEDIDVLSSDFSIDDCCDNPITNPSKLKIENSIFDEATRLNVEENSVTKIEFVQTNSNTTNNAK